MEIRANKPDVKGDQRKLEQSDSLSDVQQKKEKAFSTLKSIGNKPNIISSAKEILENEEWQIRVKMQDLLLGDIYQMRQKELSTVKCAFSIINSYYTNNILHNRIESKWNNYGLNVWQKVEDTIKEIQQRNAEPNPAHPQDALEPTSSSQDKDKAPDTTEPMRRTPYTRGEQQHKLDNQSDWRDNISQTSETDSSYINSQQSTKEAPSTYTSYNGTEETTHGPERLMDRTKIDQDPTSKRINPGDIAEELKKLQTTSRNIVNTFTTTTDKKTAEDLLKQFEDTDNEWQEAAESMERHTRESQAHIEGIIDQVKELATLIETAKQAQKDISQEKDQVPLPGRDATTSLQTKLSVTITSINVLASELIQKGYKGENTETLEERLKKRTQTLDQLENQRSLQKDRYQRMQTDLATKFGTDNQSSNAPLTRKSQELREDLDTAESTDDTKSIIGDNLKPFSGGTSKEKKKATTDTSSSQVQQSETASMARFENSTEGSVSNTASTGEIRSYKQDSAPQQATQKRVFEPITTAGREDTDTEKMHQRHVDSEFMENTRKVRKIAKKAQSETASMARFENSTEGSVSNTASTGEIRSYKQDSAPQQATQKRVFEFITTTGKEDEDTKEMNKMRVRSKAMKEFKKAQREAASKTSPENP